MEKQPCGGRRCVPEGGPKRIPKGSPKDGLEVGQDCGLGYVEIIETATRRPPSSRGGHPLDIV